MSIGGTVRSLVVDDFEPWRRFVRSKLESVAEMQILGEVSDGLKSVEQAKVFQPDLILLDIGLPTINGIEAARRIRQASPLSKILFVSTTHSPDIAEEALKTGAHGYVVKSDAATELLPAIEAILEGKRFISASLAGAFLAAATVAT
jgi:DNA-binding NarL/FixJ family response regulator